MPTNRCTLSCAAKTRHTKCHLNVVNRGRERTLPNKKRIIITCIVVLLAAAYLTSYLHVRRHRLSVEHVGSVLLFESDEQAQRWLTMFHAERDTIPLMYGDSAPLYLFFWPAIQIDSASSGRKIASPFENVKTYKIPTTGRGSQHSPRDTPSKAADGLTGNAQE